MTGLEREKIISEYKELIDTIPRTCATFSRKSHAF